MKQTDTTRNRKEYTIPHLAFSYDAANDLLYAYRKSAKVHSNVVIGEFHVELTKNGEVIGMEILNASELLREYGISSEMLRNIDQVDLRVVTHGHSTLVVLIIHALNQEKSATIAMNTLEAPINKVMAAV